MPLNGIQPPKIWLIQGKGGVGKSTVANALASCLNSQNRRVKCISPWLADIQPQENRERWSCFGDARSAYIQKKLGKNPLSRLLSRSEWLQYFSSVAPGFPQLLLMGQWLDWRTEGYDVVVDLPATGHGLIYLKTLWNYQNIFPIGPIHKDTSRMILELQDPELTRPIVVTLPSELPLKEALELHQQINILCPNISPWTWVNRIFPVHKGFLKGSPTEVTGLFFKNGEEFALHANRMGQMQIDAAKLNPKYGKWLEIPFFSRAENSLQSWQHLLLPFLKENNR